MIQAGLELPIFPNLELAALTVLHSGAQANRIHRNMSPCLCSAYLGHILDRLSFTHTHEFICVVGGKPDDITVLLSIVAEYTD